MARAGVTFLCFLQLACLHAGPEPAGDGGGGDGGLALSGFGQQYAEGFCAWQARCGGGFDFDGCVAVQTELVMNQDVPTLSLFIDAGLQRFDPASAQACLDQLAAEPCDGGEPPACLAPTDPQVPLGGTCFSKADCKEGSCGPADDYIPCPAICVPYAEDVGEDCSQTDCDPAKGLICDFTSLTCIVPSPAAGLGERCGGPYPPVGCTAGLYCDATSVGAWGECAPEVADGGVCSPSVPCLGPLECLGDGGESICRSPSAVGGPCVPLAADGLEGCQFGLACVAGTCEEPPASGPCGPDTYWECDSIHYCDPATKTCLPMVDNGQPCATSSACFGTTCVNGVCAIPAGCVP